jgi:hypothetical protein
MSAKKTRTVLGIAVLLCALAFCILFALTSPAGLREDASAAPWAEWIARSLVRRAASEGDHPDRRRESWIAAAQSYGSALRWMPWRTGLYLDAAGSYLAAGSESLALVYLTALVARAENSEDPRVAQAQTLRRNLADVQRMRAMALLEHSVRMSLSIESVKDATTEDDPHWALSREERPVLPGTRPPEPGNVASLLRRCLSEVCALRPWELSFKGRLQFDIEPNGVCCGVSVTDPALIDTAGAIRAVSLDDVETVPVKLGRIATKLYFVASAMQ